MPVHQLSKAQARQLAVRGQLLDSRRPAAVLDVVRDLTLLQNDPTAAVAPNAHLVLWSRLGSRYERAELDRAQTDRILLELRGMLRPAEDLVLYRAEMLAYDERQVTGWRVSVREWVEANDACRRDILRRLASSGPLPSGELPDTCAVPWRSSGWNDDRNVRQLLECMVVRGQVAVAGRRGNDVLWDLAERVYPDEPPVPVDEARQLRNERRLAALGIARARATEMPVEPNDVGTAGEEAVVDGVKGRWRIDPRLLDQPVGRRTALLSPLDRLVFDRKRMAELFEFDYQLEMYKPAAQRRWGYWALPILSGDRLVGKVDAKADRPAGRFRVHAVHEDEPFDAELRGQVIDELLDLADWLGLEPVLPHGWDWVRAVPSDVLLKAMNRVHRAVLRLTGNRVGASFGGMPSLELTTIGRKSGQPRSVMLTSPLQEGDAYVVVASRGGDDIHPAWFLNLRDNPDVEVRVVGQAERPMRARVATADERARMWPKIAGKYRNYAGYQKRTSREIPLVLLEP